MNTTNAATVEHDETADKIAALANHLGEPLDLDDAEKLIDDGDYLVLTDEEADEKAKEAILDSLWAFNYSFLCAHSEAINEIPEKDFQAMQSKFCESFNKAVLAMLDDVDHFVENAIGCDGRGHFLASYDSHEHERGVNGVTYYIYRCN